MPAHVLFVAVKKGIAKLFNLKRMFFYGGTVNHKHKFSISCTSQFF